MKKLLLVIPLFLFLVGCSNDYQVSNLMLNESAYYPYITGAFKNNSTTTCQTALINVEIISGTLTLDEEILLFKIAPGEIKEIKESCIECKKLSIINNVEIKVKEIKCS